MFLKKKQYDVNETVIIIPCSCGEHSIEIHHFDDKDDIIEMYVSFSVNKFLLQDGIIKTIWKRLKMASMILCGKSYRLEELILSDKDIKELEQECHNILQKGKEKNNEQN